MNSIRTARTSSLRILVGLGLLVGGAHAALAADSGSTDIYANQFERSFGQATRGDAAIAAEVRQKITEHPSLSSFDISVRSIDHDVYLEGQVDTRVDSAEARRLALAVPGVKNVYNDLYPSND